MGPEVAILDHMIFTVDAKETHPVDEELKKALEAMAAKIAELEAKIAGAEAKAGDEEVEVKAEGSRTRTRPRPIRRPLATKTPRRPVKRPRPWTP